MTENNQGHLYEKYVRGYLQALSNALSEDQLFYLRAQFTLLEPGKNGKISSENFASVKYLFSYEASLNVTVFLLFIPFSDI